MFSYCVKLNVSTLAIMFFRLRPLPEASCFHVLYFAVSVMFMQYLVSIAGFFLAKLLLIVHLQAVANCIGFF